MNNKFYTRFNLPSSKVTDISSISLTSQEFADEVTMDNILKRFNLGDLNVFNCMQPNYCDISDINDYMDAVDMVSSFEDFFFRLPSDLRDKYRNDVDFFAKAYFKDPTLVEKYFDNKNNRDNKNENKDESPPIDNVIDE